MNLFISYASINRPMVEILVSDLETFHTVWYDREMTGGQVWWNDILHNIRSCDALLFALTPDSLDSYPCQLEYQYADKVHRHIVPVMLIEVDLRQLPSILQRRNVVDYRTGDKDAMKSLLTALTRLSAAPDLPNPLPEPPPEPISPLADIRAHLNEPRLPYEQQIAIFYQLRGFMDDAKYAGDARTLMNRLAEHPALLARVLKEITAFYDTLDAPSPLEAPAPAVVQSPPPPALPTIPISVLVEAMPTLNPAYNAVQLSGYSGQYAKYHENLIAPPFEPGEKVERVYAGWLWSGATSGRVIFTDRRLIVQTQKKGMLTMRYADMKSVQQKSSWLSAALLFSDGKNSIDLSIYRNDRLPKDGIYADRKELIAWLRKMGAPFFPG